MKKLDIALQKEEERRRVERLLAILLEADLICFSKLLERRNKRKKKHVDKTL